MTLEARAVSLQQCNGPSLVLGGIDMPLEP